MTLPSPRHGRGRRRALLGLAAAVSAVALLTGCSSASSAGSDSGTGTVAKDTKADLTYAVWDQNQVDAIKANIKGFNEEYPDITVDRKSVV